MVAILAYLAVRDRPVASNFEVVWLGNGCGQIYDEGVVCSQSL